MEVDLNKSLTELEGDDWGLPRFSSPLVTACHQLRYKPLRELNDAELRLAVNQQFSLAILMPLILARLEDDPLLVASFYEGDLLSAVFRVNRRFWSAKPDLWMRSYKVAAKAFAAMESAEVSNSWIKKEFDLFLVNQPGSQGRCC